MLPRACSRHPIPETQYMVLGVSDIVYMVYPKPETQLCIWYPMPESQSSEGFDLILDKLEGHGALRQRRCKEHSRHELAQPSYSRILNPKTRNPISSHRSETTDPQRWAQKRNAILPPIRGVYTNPSGGGDGSTLSSTSWRVTGPCASGAARSTPGTLHPTP